MYINNSRGVSSLSTSEIASPHRWWRGPDGQLSGRGTSWVYFYLIIWYATISSCSFSSTYYSSRDSLHANVLNMYVYWISQRGNTAIMKKERVCYATVNVSIFFVWTNNQPGEEGHVKNTDLGWFVIIQQSTQQGRRISQGGVTTGYWSGTTDIIQQWTDEDKGFWKDKGQQGYKTGMDNKQTRTRDIARMTRIRWRGIKMSEVEGITTRGPDGVVDKLLFI